MEAVGLVAPRAQPAPPAAAAAAAAATGTSDPTTALDASPRVEILARLVGEVTPPRDHGGTKAEKAQKKESDKASSAAGAGTSAANPSGSAPVPSAGGGIEGNGAGSGGGGDAALKEGTEPPSPPDLIVMDDLAAGWEGDQIPSRWPILMMPCGQPGSVTVLCRGRRRKRRPQSPAAGDEAALATTTATVTTGAGAARGPGGGGQAADASGGSASVSTVDPSETTTTTTEAGGEPLPKRRSFRLSSSSSFSLSSAQKPVTRTQSSSSFASLPSRIGRRASRVPPTEEHTSGAAAATRAESGKAGNDIGARNSRSRSPIPFGSVNESSASAGGLWWMGMGAGEEGAVALDLLLPSGPELLAPLPPPLPPPLPHKPEMMLVDRPSSSSFGTHGEGGANGGSGGGTGGSTGSALTSLPSLSSLLATAHSVRGAGGGGNGHGDYASGASPGSNAATDASVPLAAEAVGEPQHMDQLFNMLEVDLGMGRGPSGETASKCRGRTGAKLQEGGGPWPWGGADNGSRLDVGQGQHLAARSGGGQNAFGAVPLEVEADVDFNASLWHILQVHVEVFAGRLRFCRALDALKLSEV